jgi:predicted GNAT family acetyltransferase
MPSEILEPLAFLSLASRLLQPHAAFHNLILGQAVKVSQKPQSTNWAAHLLSPASESVLLALQMSPSAPLILADIGKNDATTWAELSQALLKSGRSFSEIRAPEQIATEWLDFWQNQQGGSSQLRMRQGVYHCKHVCASPSQPGDLRLATPADLPLLAQWLGGFYQDALFENPPPKAELNMAVQQKLSEEALFIWENGTEPSAMTAIVRKPPGGSALSWVYTPPELRGQGWASACVAALTEQLLASGQTYTCLFTDLNNAQSNRLYQRLGYQQLGVFVSYRYIPESAQACTHTQKS